MADTYEVSMRVKIKKNGNRFFDSGKITWPNLEYPYMNAMEKYFVAVLADLTKKGEPGGEWGPDASGKRPPLK